MLERVHSLVTLWSITDEIAFKFTKELYDQIHKGAILGEAVHAARNLCKEEGDPSWLAYELYGQPNMQIKFGDK